MRAPLDVAKLKARALQRAMPAYFKLSQAQEALARLLSFKDWHHLAQEGAKGHPLLPTRLLQPTDPEFAPTLYRVVVFLADEYRVPTETAQAFYYGWGVFSPSLAEPYKGEYAFWAEALEKGPSPECLRDSGGPQDWLDEYDVIRIADGIVQACPYGKHSYWFLSDERLKAMPAALRGIQTVFNAHEDPHRVMLSFPDAFTPSQVEDAWRRLETELPGVFELYTGRQAEAMPYPSLSPLTGIQQAKRHPTALFPLSLRWMALPYSPDPGRQIQPVISALRGVHLAALIESRGELKLQDVHWFQMQEGEPLKWDDILFRNVLRPITPGEVRACSPQYGYPFKHGPFYPFEYARDMEGGNPGLGFVPESFGSDEDDES